MTFKTWSFALALTASALLTACGGSSSTNTNVRLMNATTDCASLTMNVNGAAVSSSSAIAQGAVASSYNSLGSSLVNLTFSCTQNGSTTTYYSNPSFSVSGTAGPYTLVMAGTASSPQLFFLNENAGTPASGTFNIRVLDTASSAGTLSVFMVNSTNTGSNSDLTSAPLVFSGVNSATFNNSYSNSTTPSTNLYEVVVTGSNRVAGVTNDVRMDIPNVPIANQSNLTLILSSGASGNLVNGYLLNQQGNIVATTTSTGLARVRVVNGMAVTSNTLTTASSVFTTSNTLPKFVNAHNTLLSSTPVTPTAAAIGAYVTVPTDSADSTSISVTMGSNTFSIPATVLATGQDYTLLVYGNSSYNLVIDNNILPTQTSVASNFVNVRLYNAVSGSTGSMLVTSINQPVSSTISSAYGSSSGSVTLANNPFFTCSATGSSVTLSATGLGTGNSFNATGLTTYPGYLYSVFVTGNVASPNVQVTTDYQTATTCQ